MRSDQLRQKKAPRFPSMAALLPKAEHCGFPWIATRLHMGHSLLSEPPSVRRKA